MLALGLCQGWPDVGVGPVSGLGLLSGFGLCRGWAYVRVWPVSGFGLCQGLAMSGLGLL